MNPEKRKEIAERPRSPYHIPDLLRDNEELEQRSRRGPCCKEPDYCGGDCTCEICEPSLTIRDLRIQAGDAQARIAALEQRLAGDRWIPVSEKLPPLGVEVLWWRVHVSGSGDYILGCRHDNNLNPAFTHWRPLPAAPEGEKP